MATGGIYEQFHTKRKAETIRRLCKTDHPHPQCSVTLVFISVILTGFNIYPKIGKFGGAGSLVPITGFANSVAAPAIEYKTEGQVFGIGCKIFTIAGPVILYGIMSSWVAGVIYYLLKIMEVIS